MFPLRTLASVFVVTVVCLPLFAGAEVPGPTVYRNVSSAALERVLGDLNIQFRKSTGNKPAIHFYDFTRNGYTIRLHNYEGNDLWIEALCTNRLSLDEVNRWNQRAKFSRCVRLENNNKVTVSLENQFDARGGCTDAIVRQFILRFDNEVRTFDGFVEKLQAR